MKELKGKRVAILVANGFEQSEFEEPRRALLDAGAIVEVVSPEDRKVKGWNHTDWGDEFDVDVKLDSADESSYDAVVLPGGVLNPDKLRVNKTAVEFVRTFLMAGKPVAAICHGPQILIETGLIKDREMTSYPSVKTDLINAGANWIDREVVVDNGLVTSRSPADLKAFNRKMIEEIGEGIHNGRSHGERRTPVI